MGAPGSFPVLHLQFSDTFLSPVTRQTYLAYIVAISFYTPMLCLKCVLDF